MHFLPFSTIKTLTLRMDHGKLLDILTSLPVSRSILPRAVYFAMSRPANHAICSFIDLSGIASGPIRRCLFIDYIIKDYITITGSRFIKHFYCSEVVECLPVDLANWVLFLAGTVWNYLALRQWRPT